MKLFNEIKDNCDLKLFSLLPPRHIPNYNLRRSRDFVYPRVKTKRFCSTFVPASVKNDFEYK